jgi:hypothetical protein
MLVAETLKNRKTLVLFFGLNIFVIQQFLSQVLRSLFEKTLD